MPTLADRVGNSGHARTRDSKVSRTLGFGVAVQLCLSPASAGQGEVSPMIGLGRRRGGRQQPAQQTTGRRSAGGDARRLHLPGARGGTAQAPAAGELPPDAGEQRQIDLQLREGQPQRVTNVQIIRRESPGAESQARIEPVRSGAVGPEALTGCELPTFLFDRHDRRDLIDLRALSMLGLVLYIYPGSRAISSDGSERRVPDSLQHEAYRSLRSSFAEVIPHGAIVALSSLSRIEQFRCDPQLALEQLESQDFAHHLITDEGCYLARELGLATFECAGKQHYERITLIARGGRIETVLHPVDPETDASQALACLRAHQHLTAQ